MHVVFLHKRLEFLAFHPIEEIIQMCLGLLKSKVSKPLSRMS
jgi:hypothetical protein